MQTISKSVPYLQRVHGITDLPVVDLLIERVALPVGAWAILFGDDEGVKVGAALVFLGAECKAFGQAQLKERQDFTVRKLHRNKNFE